MRWIFSASSRSRRDEIAERPSSVPAVLVPNFYSPVIIAGDPSFQLKLK